MLGQVEMGAGVGGLERTSVGTVGMNMYVG